MVGKAGILLLYTVAAVVVVAHGAGPAAASPSSAAATVRQLAAAGDWPPARVRPVLDELDRETRRFVAMSPGAAAQRVGDELIPVLAAIHEGLTTRLDGMRNEVLERDGDIEALLASPGYRDRETLQLTALYHLSWARYQQAQTMASQSSTRRKLLQQAVRGFTEFVYVNEVSQVYGDCLYGRGLAFYALGQTQNARADLQAVIDLGSKHPSYARARAALDAVRRGKPIRPAAAAAPDPTATQLARLKTLLAAHGGVPGPAKNLDAAALEQRARAQDEALTLARALARRGPTMSERVEKLVAETATPAGAFVHVLRGEIASDREDSAAARDEYATAMAATDLDAARLHARSSYGLAVAHYRLGDYPAAAAAFGEFATTHPEAGDAAAALYFRFKAIEAARAAEGSATPEQEERYLEAARAYLERFPDGEHGAELRYRIAEVEQRRGECEAALTTLGDHRGTDSWSLWGRFVGIQCQAERTRAAWRAGEPQAQALYDATIESARALATDAAAADDERVDTESIGAQASLLGALVAAAAPTPRPGDVLSLVDDFQVRFPHSTGLFGDAIALRAVAHVHRADIEVAMADVDALSALQGVDAAPHLRDIGSAVMREANRGGSARRKVLLPLAQHVYTQLTAREGDGNGPPETADLATLAEVSLEIGDIDAAERAYQRLLKIDPDSLEGQRGLARISAARGEHEAALARWQRLIDQSSVGDTLWLEATIEAARMQAALGRTAEACTRLTEAARQAPFPSTGDLGTTYVALRQQVCQ